MSEQDKLTIDKLIKYRDSILARDEEVREMMRAKDMTRFNEEYICEWQPVLNKSEIKITTERLKAINDNLSKFTPNQYQMAIYESFKSGKPFRFITARETYLTGYRAYRKFLVETKGKK